MRWILTFLLLLPFCGFSQDSSAVVNPPKIDSQLKAPQHVVEIRCMCSVEASFPGGTTSLNNYLSKHLALKGEPAFDRLKCVTVDFVVDVDGAISDIEVLKCDDPDLRKLIVHTIAAMPKWIPYEFECNYVRSKIRIPITFEWI